MELIVHLSFWFALIIAQTMVFVIPKLDYVLVTMVIMVMIAHFSTWFAQTIAQITEFVTD